MTAVREPLRPPISARIVGVDEAGRGPLAGPVVAAAVLLPRASTPVGVTDSKRLSARARQRLAGEIRTASTAFAIGIGSVADILAFNILGATMLAMQRAVAGLNVALDHVLVDGNRAPDFRVAGRSVPAAPIVKGDATIACIGAASILAKVHRDALMDELDQAYPEYGFARHKGYATAEHRAALHRHGATPHHRAEFAPVREVLASPERMS
ncbi:MAG: ribonuclease HII [Pseudomonadota bacterium]